MKNSNSIKRIISVISVLVLIGIWKVASMLYQSDLILPSPESTIIATLNIFINEDFFKVIGVTISIFTNVAVGIDRFVFKKKK